MSITERLIISREDVQRAERREGVAHPVIDILDRYSPEISAFQKRYESLPTGEAEFTYTARNFGFIADAVERVSFSLGPLDIIAILSKAREDLEYYPRHALARIVLAAYAIQGVPNDAWKGFPRYFLRRQKIPPKVAEDEEGLSFVKTRIDEVGTSLDQIHIVTYGRIQPMQYIADLWERIRGGDEAAMAELEELQNLSSRNETPVIGEINENFSSNFKSLYLEVEDAFRKLEK